MIKNEFPYRQSIRLKGWDYSNPGLYFITICTKNRQHHFGEIHDGVMGLSIPGCLAYYFWTQIPKHFPNIILDECMVMPNHIHVIIGITGGNAIHGDRGIHDARTGDHDPDAMNRVPTNPDQSTNIPGSPINRDRGVAGARGGDDDPDAINRVPTNPDPSTKSPKNVGSPINRDQNHSKPKNKTHGGITQHQNPMLYKDHLGKIIRWYKGRCSFEIRKRQYYDFAWQPRFYDHIIRNEKELDRIREYIFNNPLKWQFDNENPDQIHEMNVKYLVNQ